MNELVEDDQLIKLYKYKSLKDLWHVLDLILNQRLYCASWQMLNDPLEGRYEIFLGDKSKKLESIMISRIEDARNNYRIASLSADPTNFLLWSHYADGHKGIAVEIEMPRDQPELTEVQYTEFSSVFTEKAQTTQNMRHIFNGKSEEWSYEKEYRILTEEQEYFKLPAKPSRLLLGPMASEFQKEIIYKILNDSIEIVMMDLDQIQGTLTVVGPPNSSLEPNASSSHLSLLDSEIG